MGKRNEIVNKKRIVVKIGSSSLIHSETGGLNYTKMEKLVRILADLSNQGRDVILVSSGAIATGRNIVHVPSKANDIPVRQACAAIGQAQLIAIYQRMFTEYGKTAAQVLLTRYTIHSELTRTNATNTFKELLKLGAIPVVNENDTVTTEEIEFGDNDGLSAMVGILAEADLLIILSDIDGLYDSDPRTDKDAHFISVVESLDDNILNMGGKAGSQYGTGGMASKLEAAKMAAEAGIDMVITNANDLDNIIRVMNGEDVGTFFEAGSEKCFVFEEFDIKD